MPLYTKKDFVELCGLKSMAHLSMAIKREKVIVSGKFIDDSIEPNKSYKIIQQEKNGVNDIKPSKKPEKPEKKPDNTSKNQQKTPKKDKKIIEIPFEDPDADKLSHAGTIRTLEKKEKQLKIERSEQERKLNELRLAKIRGELIPLDHVKNLFSIHFKSVTVSFHQASDNLATEMCKILGGKREDLVKIRGALVDIINEAVVSSKESTSNEISNIVEEIANQKGTKM